MSQPLFLDIETEPTSHDKAYPACSIATVAIGDAPARIYDPAQALPIVAEHVARGGVVVGHNLPYDVVGLGAAALVPPESTYDTYIRDVLEGAASGRHADASSSLEKIARRHGIAMPNKKKEISLSFGGATVASLSPVQRAYALGDVDATRQIWKDQGGMIRRPDEARQTLLSYDVFHMGRRGVPLDRPYILDHLMQAQDEVDFYTTHLTEIGLIGAGSRKKLQALLKANGVTKLPKRRATDDREPSGLLASDGATLRETGDPDLIALANYHRADKKKQLWEAFDTGGSWARAWWRPLVASGRLACSKPNLTQVPRVGGFREAVCAPPGKKLVVMDFKGLEFYVWAATCQRWLGFSEAAKILRQGVDPHGYVARAVMEAAGGDFTERRQQAKAMNYGLIGGMSVGRLAASLHVDEATAARLARVWRGIFWEFGPYKARLQEHPVRYPKFEVTLPCGRVRQAFMTEILNVVIQGGGADVVKDTLHMAERDGVPTVLLPHDEFVILADERDADELGHHIASLAAKAGNERYPEVPWGGQEFTVVDRWKSKGA